MRPADERTTIPREEWPARREAAVQQLRQQLTAMRDDTTHLPMSDWKRVQHLWLFETVLNESDKLGLPAKERERFLKRQQGLTGNEDERDRQIIKMLIELADKLGAKAS
jgi:hypothetical protein